MGKVASIADHAPLPPWMHLWWNTLDRFRTLSRLAAVGLALAGILAILGLPPVDLHAPTHYLGVMDPLCGMTRGVRLVVRGDIPGALRYNPAAPLVPLGGILLLARRAYGARPGRWADVSVRWTPALVTVTGLAIAVLWTRQQANVNLLTNG